MQPTYHPLEKIFGGETRYMVPLFQRPYVWGQEEQWEPLWDDLRKLASRVLETEPSKPVPGHFLGTIVLEQSKSRTGSIPRREIIDGQQRLTTLQVLLKALEHSLGELFVRLDPSDPGRKKVEVSGKQIAALTANPAYAEDDEKYKVWPTNEDRTAFRQVMDAEKPSDVEASSSTLAGAYMYFRQAISQWLAGLNDSNQMRAATALSASIKDHVKLIVLDLDDTDEPQAIFETLNAHGTPLLSGDLIKNWLLWEASRAGPGHPLDLYNAYWAAFDQDQTYWRQVVGAGHAARPRFDTFLQNWLMRRTKEPVASKHIYNEFLHFAAATTGDPLARATNLMKDIYEESTRYRYIEQPVGNSRFDTFLRRLSVLDVIVFHPLLLAVMRRTEPGAPDRNAVGEILESYLIRRMVCWEQTRTYGFLALELLKLIEELPADTPISSVLKSRLLNPTSASFGWPDDEKFKQSWTQNKFYGGYRRSRVQMILEAIEEHYQRQGVKGEPILKFDFSELQIEHVLPQKWKKHWPLPQNDNAEEIRSGRLHNIGNLTLVTGNLNPTLSNAAWLDGPSGKKGKRSALEEHSKLQLNAQLVKKYGAEWSDVAISHRSADLFEVARQIWARPNE